MFVNMPHSASALAELEVALSEVLGVCVCVFFFGHGILFPHCVAEERRRNEPKSDGTPIASTRVMNYSVSSFLACYYHRVCQTTGLTAVTAPRTHFPLTTDTFLIRSLPLSCTMVLHSTLFIYLSGRGAFPITSNSSGSLKPQCLHQLYYTHILSLFSTHTHARAHAHTPINHLVEVFLFRLPIQQGALVL